MRIKNNIFSRLRENANLSESWARFSFCFLDPMTTGSYCMKYNDKSAFLHRITKMPWHRISPVWTACDVSINIFWNARDYRCDKSLCLSISSVLGFVRLFTSILLERLWNFIDRPLQIMPNMSKGMKTSNKAHKIARDNFERFLGDMRLSSLSPG
jgi:hypothetical protein